MLIPQPSILSSRAGQMAAGDVDLPKEAVHFPASMLAVGYGSVVVTMWSIANEDGPVVVDTSYASVVKIREGGIGVAYVLHEAVKALRYRVEEDSFLRWDPVVHFG
ncbi:hypothetical protein K488DRAFT_47113 [Vararia minispora EC-137]|uniref:Uncharacterized protein n=1 Tax=Vararia minispora EC-137 TaxID=1314806 RepID=A0ACB8QQF1_9AGAM|nr:hypothetical protein K488DRAFT_47113 [Vararia minispora EC-137]